MRRLCVSMCLAFAAPLLAQTPAETAPPAPLEAAAASPPADAVLAPAPAAADADRELAAFVTGAVEALRARTGIAGVVVAVVAKDRTRLVAGYGYADVQARRPADGATSLFRIGSISKTLTYVATMQLIEQGRLGLDDPVNERLPETLRVPDDGYAEPIRVRHLLTHTAGYEDTALGHLFNRDPARELTLDAYLVQHRPQRVRAPGTSAAYSNYSIALLGALVAHVANMPFEDYVEQQLTGPLGMTRTTFREPGLLAPHQALDAARAAQVATGYDRRGGTYEPGWFEHIAHGAPAGGASASAGDMARWMRMLLGDGTLDGTTVLGRASARRMHQEILHRNAPHVDGVAYGFLTERYGPYAAYGHGGATLYFHSALVLVPELDLGVFVSANTSNARQPMRDLVRLIVEHVEPRARPSVTPIAADRAALARYVGAYRSNRRPYATAEKLLLTLGGDATVTAADDGTLRVHAGGDTVRYAPIGPALFQEADGNARLEFLSDAEGRVQGYAYGFGVSVAERIGPLETLNALFALLAGAGLVAAARVVRSLRRAPKTRHPPRPGLAAVKALAVADAIAWIAFLGVAAVAASRMAAEGNDVVHTYPSTGFKAALALATLAAVTTLLEVGALVPVWRGAWRTWPKIRYTLAVAVLALAVHVMWTWNLIGMRL
jgi:CubicO group peptidase (beta-lactamase class C family)